MQISRTLLNGEVLHGRTLPMYSVILRLDNKVELVCSNFNHSRKEKLEIFCYLPTEKKWVRFYVKNEYTEMMWDFNRKYYKPHDKKLNVRNLMKHDRKRKKPSGRPMGDSRIVTDYECTKHQLHDFNRTMYLG